MAQRILLYMPSDGAVLTPSPLTYIDTLYYELWYRISGATNWNQSIFYSPLPEYMVGSPLTSMPCIVLSTLPDSTTYEYQVRRFNSDNEPAEWFADTFTTGQ